MGGGSHPSAVPQFQVGTRLLSDKEFDNNEVELPRQSRGMEPSY